MNFVKRMNSVLDYIENNLDGEIEDDKIAVLSANPRGMFQRIFSMITDMTLSEYVRKRRLTQAAADIQSTDAKIIDIAVKYGYNSAEYFASAFKNFHGITPSDARNPNIKLQSFQRLAFTSNLTITGGNNNMQYRTISLDETIYFWLRSDFLILNNVLCGKMKELWKGAEKANENSKWMLNAFEEDKRMLDEKEIVRYKNRSYETLDDEAKDNIIKIAKIDIANLLNAMKPIKNEMLLYRTIWCDQEEFYGLPRYDVDDIVEFKIISSTAIAPYMENKVEPDVPYSDWLNENLKREFYRFEITVPVNGFALQLDEYEEYSQRWWEKGEVILPPMKCRVKNIRKSNIEKCRGIFEFEYLERLPDPV
ncbi:MAG: AraC family transcriptional regulator [Oscillospiraceae bacterium]|nr:AraC family transcriptional regulator [Oscillospiraceae bacterium]